MGDAVTLRRTTNPSVATGDGLAITVRAGATSVNMAFFQFRQQHLWQEIKAVSITKRSREGGVLLDDEFTGLQRNYEHVQKPNQYSFTLPIITSRV